MVRISVRMSGFFNNTSAIIVVSQEMNNECFSLLVYYIILTCTLSQM